MSRGAPALSFAKANALCMKFGYEPLSEGSSVSKVPSSTSYGPVQPILRLVSKLAITIVEADVVSREILHATLLQH
jgi:hypothetical protein